MEQYENKVASLIMACPNLEALAGPLMPYNHKFNRIFHALSTRRKLKTMDWRIEPSAAQQEPFRPESAACGLSANMPADLDASQEMVFLGHHRSRRRLPASPSTVSPEPHSHQTPSSSERSPASPPSSTSTSATSPPTPSTTTTSSPSPASRRSPSRTSRASAPAASQPLQPAAQASPCAACTCGTRHSHPSPRWPGSCPTSASCASSRWCRTFPPSCPRTTTSSPSG